MSTPRKLGRPSKYRKEYCEQIVEAGKRGISFEKFASSVNAHRDTLHEWATKFPEFSDAMKRSKQEQLNYWMDIGQAAMMDKTSTVNPTLWIFWMKARHGWRDHDPFTMPEDGDLRFV